MKIQFSVLLATATITTGTVAIFAVAPAHAAKGDPTGISCAVSDIVLGGTNATACEGAFKGNDTGNRGTLLDKLNNNLFSNQIGTDINWNLAAKSDNSNPQNPFANNPNTSTGTLSLNNLSAFLGETFVISLKAGNGYSAYLFQDFQGNDLNAIYNTIGVAQNRRGAAKDLSHASLWVSNIQRTTPTPDKIPEPGTILGLSLVATGMIMARRRSLAK